MSRGGIVLREHDEDVQRQRPFNGIRTDDRKIFLEVRRAEGFLKYRMLRLFGDLRP